MTKRIGPRYELSESERARFLTRFRRPPGDGCWEWTGRCNNKGYGRFAVYRSGETFNLLAHRVALSLELGREPNGDTRHACDNPPCVRPDHLSEGTRSDNMRDARDRGRVDVSGLDAWRQKRTREVQERLADGSKPCHRCGVTKPLVGGFYRNRRNPDGHHGLCIPCFKLDTKRVVA